MGTPALGIGTHYGDTMVAVDVSDIIYQITPVDTPLYNAIPDGSASGPWHEWSRRSLTTRGDNAQVEGFTFDFTALNVYPTRLGNVSHIFRKEARVSGTEQAIQHYAIADVFGDQMAMRMVEYKTDIERALFCSTINTGATGTARRMQGLAQAIISGISTYTGTTDGAPDQFTETLLNDIIQQGWDFGAEYRDIFVGGNLKRGISTFGTEARRYIAADEHREVNTITEYDSDFFTVQTHLSRDVPNRYVTGVHTHATGHGAIFSDLSMLKKAWLRRSTAKRAPETADSMDGLIYGELTLEYGHPNGHYWLMQATAAA